MEMDTNMDPPSSPPNLSKEEDEEILPDSQVFEVPDSQSFEIENNETTQSPNSTPPPPGNSPVFKKAEPKPDLALNLSLISKPLPDFPSRDSIIRYKRIRNSGEGKTWGFPPKKHYGLDTGFDLATPFQFTLEKNETKVIPLGLQIHMPFGTYGRIASRSGLASDGIIVLGGVLDYGYVNEVKVILHNLGTTRYFFGAGNRIAQLIPEKIEYPGVEENLERGFFDHTYALPDKEAKRMRRGGFGSTGK